MRGRRMDGFLYVQYLSVEKLCTAVAVHIHDGYHG